MKERISEARKAFGGPAPRRTVAAAARVHSNDRASGLRCCFAALFGLVVAEYKRTSHAPLLLAQWYKEPFVANRGTDCLSHGHVVLGLMQSAEAMIFDPHIQ